MKLCIGYSPATFVLGIRQVPLCWIFTRYLCIRYSPATFVLGIRHLPLYWLFARYLCVVYSSGTFLLGIRQVPLYWLFAKVLCIGYSPGIFGLGIRQVPCIWVFASYRSSMFWHDTMADDVDMRCIWNWKKKTKRFSYTYCPPWHRSVCRNALIFNKIIFVKHNEKYLNLSRKFVLKIRIQNIDF